MKTLHKIVQLLAVVALLAPAVGRAAEYVVIVNAANKATAVSKAELQRYFFRTATAWPGGEACRPVDLPKESAARVAFTREVLGRTMTSLTQFWTLSVFSGRAVPPTERRGDRDVVEYVRENAGAIGYVSAGASTEGVKTVKVTD